MRVELNGSSRELADGATLADAVRESGAEPEARGVAVALDGEVVPRVRVGQIPRSPRASRSRSWPRSRGEPRPGSSPAASGARG